MYVLKFPEWQRLCEMALSERDSGQVVQRIVAAETAIFRRLQQLEAGPDSVELQSMDATLQRLRLLVTHLRTGSNARGRVVTMLVRNGHNGLIYDGIKGKSRLASSDSDQPA